MNLTPKQLRILKLIRDSRVRRGYSPTMQELADEIGVSKVTVFEHVEALIKKGALVREPNKARSLSIADGIAVPDESRPLKFPLVGKIAAGYPIEKVEDVLNMPIKVKDGTVVRFRDVAVGEVEGVSFAPDLSVVLVDVRVDREIAPYLDDATLVASPDDPAESVWRIGDVRVCPRDPKADERRQSGGTSFLLNEYVAVPLVGPFGGIDWTQTYNRLDRIPRPSQTPVIFIGADRWGVSRAHLENPDRARRAGSARGRARATGAGASGRTAAGSSWGAVGCPLSAVGFSGRTPPTAESLSRQGPPR